MFWKSILVVIVLSLTTCPSYANQIDSLKQVLDSPLPTNHRLQTLLQIINELRFSPDSVIKYGQELKGLDDENSKYSALANFYIGQAYKDKAQYELSIEYLFDALAYSQAKGEIDPEVLGALGAVFGRIGDMNKSSFYFRQILNAPADESISKIKTLQAYNNMAEAFYQNGYYDSAFVNFVKARNVARDNEMKDWERFISGNVGMVNLKLGNLDSAEVQLRSVLQMLSESQISYITFETFLAEVYLEKGQLRKSEELLIRIIATSESLGYKEQIRDAYKLLSLLRELSGDYDESLKTYKKYVALKEEIKDVETIRKIGDIRTKFEVGQKQAEVDLLTAEKRNQQLVLIGLTLLALGLIILAIIIYKFYQSKAKINSELERLNQTKDKFFSIISHDLRGPVSSFMGISRMIKFLVKSKETDQLLEVADDIDESVDRLSALLDNLLNWAMQQQGHFPNVPEKVDLKELSEDLVRTLHTMAIGKQITLDHSIESEINLWVDRNTTMTILRNLVNNALKFTPEGGQVSIDAHQSSGVAQINVSDTGVGIPKDKLDKLFQLEDKKSTYGTSGEKGLGLGLQLVYEFIEMNQGTIQVRSEEGKGTTFTVRLPVYETEREPEGIIRERSETIR